MDSLRPVPARVGLALLITAMLLLQAGCFNSLARPDVAPDIAPSPSEPWKPAPGQVEAPAQATATPLIPPELLKAKDQWSLINLVDIALRNNTQTRAAWAAARAAAANVGSQQGAFYPQIDVGGDLTWTQQALRKSYPRQETTLGPSASLSYILYDGGGRQAAVDEARQALFSANLTHNATIQNVLLQVIQTYYQYLNSKALLEAEQTAYKAAQASLDAAEQRHQAGVATVADVLQAKAALSQIQLTIETIKGQIQVIRGALATAAGLPANVTFDVESRPVELSIPLKTRDVETLITRAMAQRPDLSAMRAEVKLSQAHIRKVQAAGSPTLSLGSSVSGAFNSHARGFGDNVAVGISLNFPLFTGYTHTFNVMQAKAQAEQTREQYRTLEQEITLQVWSSYYNLQTADQRIKAAKDLLDSASQSYDVALGRYKAGVGNVVDLLNAQSVLENARAQSISARTDWYLALAQLVHDTGALKLDALGLTMPPANK